MPKLIKQNLQQRLNHCLNVGDEVLGDILAAIPSCVKRFVTLGTAVTVDEAIWAYHSLDAKRRGKLRHIPAKPHPDGLLTYMLCQRLHFSNRPIALAFAPTFINPQPSPRDHSSLSSYMQTGFCRLVGKL